MRSGLVDLEEDSDFQNWRSSSASSSSSDTLAWRRKENYFKKMSEREEKDVTKALWLLHKHILVLPLLLYFTSNKFNMHLCYLDSMQHFPFSTKSKVQLRLMAKIIKIHPLATINISTKYHGNASSSCWDILVVAWPPDHSAATPLSRLKTLSITKKITAACQEFKLTITWYFRADSKQWHQSSFLFLRPDNTCFGITDWLQVVLPFQQSKSIAAALHHIINMLNNLDISFLFGNLSKTEVTHG